MENLKEIIIKWRTLKGFTQEEFSELAGVTPITLSTWETGRNYPRKKNLRLLADNLGISFEEFLNGPIGKTEKKPELKQFVRSFEGYSLVGVFSGVSDSWETSYHLGIRFGAIGPSPSENYHFLYMDTDRYREIGIPFGCEVMFLYPYQQIKETDLVLVYSNTEGPEIIPYEKVTNNHTILGKKLSIRYREDIIKFLETNNRKPK